MSIDSDLAVCYDGERLVMEDTLERLWEGKNDREPEPIPGYNHSR